MTDADPFLLFDTWFEEAKQSRSISEANAVNLATATKTGRPSNRMVLLKNRSNSGFVFYTNTKSRKGAELLDNPYASLCFYWEALFKQIRIEGKIEPVPAPEADAYFSSRPLKSRIGAWASRQSEPLESADILLKRVAALSVKYTGKEIPRPPFWSGFQLVPERMEFWKKGEFRLHNRILFQRTANTVWQKSLLYP